MHKPLSRVALALALTASLAGCATSRIESAWVDPSTTPQSFALKRVITIAPVSDGVLRRSAEDALVRAILAGPRGQNGQLEARPSYTLLEANDLRNVDVARKKVEAAGYDGAVLISFVSSQQQVTVTPPSYNGGFWGPYGYGRSGMYYDPGSVRTDTILRLQVDIYSLADGKMLWSGMSRTFNPSSVDKLVTDVAEAVRDDLRERGLAN